MNINAVLITAAITAFIPWLVALVTHQQAHPGLKAVLLLLLTAVTGVLTAWQADPNYDWQHGALYAFEGFIVAVGAHFGLWKPTEVTPGIQRAVPQGLGKRP